MGRARAARMCATGRVPTCTHAGIVMGPNLFVVDAALNPVDALVMSTKAVSFLLRLMTSDALFMLRS